MKLKTLPLRNLAAALLALAVVSLLDAPLALGVADPAITNRARQAFTEKKFELVTDLLREHLAELEKSDLLLLGKSYGELKNTLLAQKVYVTGLAKIPNDPEIKSLLGLEQFRSGKDKDAIVTLKEVIEKNKTFLPAYQTLVQIFEKKKSFYELRLLYQDMIERFGEKPDFVSKLCELTAKDSHYELALKYCALGVRLNPKDPNNLVYWGLALKDTQKIPQAEATFKRAADSFSKSELAQVSYGHFLEDKKNYIDAIKYYRKAVLINSQSLPAQLGLAKTAFEIQKLEESLKAFDTACKLDRSSLPHFRRAIASLRATKDSDWLRKFESSADRCD